MSITPTQKAVFNYIKDYIAENDFSPTFDEIALHFKYRSKGTVYKHIKALRLNGLIRQEWNRVRAIELASTKNTTMRTLPVKGVVYRGKLSWNDPPYRLMSISPDVALNNRSFVLEMDTNEFQRHDISRGDNIIVQPFVTKRGKGKIIVENRSRNIVLKNPGQQTKTGIIIGQLTGLVRSY